MSEHNRRLSDTAARFARSAMGSLSDDPRELTELFLAFHATAKEHEAEHAASVSLALRRIDDPEDALPRIVEKVGQARKLLDEQAGKQPSAETLFLSRAMLGQALTLLGRKDLVS